MGYRDLELSYRESEAEMLYDIRSCLRKLLLEIEELNKIKKEQLK